MSGDNQIKCDAFLDGTNIPTGTDYIEVPTPKVLPWYIPANSSPSLNWKEKLERLRSRFERLIDEFTPIESFSIQTRIPAWGSVPSNFPPGSNVGKVIFSLNGLSREPTELISPQGMPLDACFTIKGANGQGILRADGKSRAMRFGLTRHFLAQPQLSWDGNFKSLPIPRLRDLCVDGSLLLYELPPALAVTVWRNWPQGFSRTLNSDASLWLDALFELSWKNEKGFPLSSTRFAWRNNFSLALLGKGNFPRLPNGIHALEEDGLHEQGYPFASYARLNDVARASIYAIDQLLAIDISAPEALRDKMKIPDSVIYIVGDVIGQWYYSHSKLNTLFGGSGFPGEPPEGNCVHKSQEWLRRANKSESEPVQLLGAVLTDYMNLEHWNDPKWKSGYEKITTILRKNGLQFRLNEVIGENADATKSIAVPESTLQVSTIPSGAPLSNATILFLAANPDNSTRLALDLESREIREKIRASEFPKQLSFRTEWAIRPDDLLQYLNEYKPTVVHFSGHGSTNEEIILHDINEQPKAVSKEALKALFAAFRHCVKLLVLNSCYSRAQAEGVTEVVDCAVGMKRAIGDEAARVFAASFYRALGFGLSVKDAFEQGKAALLLQGIGEDETPDLLVRSGIDPSKVYITRA